LFVFSVRLFVSFFSFLFSFFFFLSFSFLSREHRPTGLSKVPAFRHSGHSGILGIPKVPASRQQKK
jgi:hypothetical protein